MFICLALGIIALIAGAMLPERPPWNLALFITGIVLVLLGVLLWVQGGTYVA